MSDLYDYIDKYFKGNLTIKEKQEFENSCLSDNELAEEVAIYITINNYVYKHELHKVNTSKQHDSDELDFPTQDESVRILTEPERHLLKLIAEGYSDDQIAEKLNVHTAIIRTRHARLLQKLKAENSAMLIRLALKHRLF